MLLAGQTLWHSSSEAPVVAASARTTARTSPGTDEPALAAVVEARSTATDISDPPLVELTPPPAHHRVALTTRAAPADLRYELPPPDVTRRQGKLKRNEFIATILTDAGATLACCDCCCCRTSTVAAFAAIVVVVVMFGGMAVVASCATAT
ncbi:MAG: hypothetical protein AAFY60_19800, partial [Myxococcota bacterium]